MSGPEGSADTSRSASQHDPGPDSGPSSGPSPGPDEGSTLRGFAPGARPAVMWTRRGVIGLLAVALLAALLGVFGLHTGSASATGNGYLLQVRYPQIARAGLDIVWIVEVKHPGGFGKQITLRLTADYGDILEHQNYAPQPTSESEDGRWDYLTFTTSPGNTFRFDVDAYIQPASQQGRSAEISVLGARRRPLVTVNFQTSLLP